MNEWQPISTAPMSKRVLVACSRGYVLIAVHDELRGWLHGDDIKIYDTVTHWQPIPEPPK